MRLFILLILATVILKTGYSQIPQFINYQGVARDNLGLELQNQSIGLRISILDNSPNGPVQMEETHTVTTNQFGLFNINIGNGTPLQGTLASVNWRAGTSKWLKIEMDAAGGNNYVLMGTQQLVSVPYSLYANDAGNLQGNPVDTQVPQINQALIWNGTMWTPTNISINTNTNTNNAESLIYTIQGF